MDYTQKDFETMTFKFTHSIRASHQPVLYEMLRSTTGPVIEFGSGEHSTALIHEMCGGTRKIITLDDNEDWLNRYRPKFESNTHEFIYVPKPPRVAFQNGDHWHKILADDKIKNVAWDLVFIDQNPWLARYYTLLALNTAAKYVVLHDSDYFFRADVFGTCEVGRQMLKEKKCVFDTLFKTYKIYPPTAPWPTTSPPTLLGSNIVSEFPKIEYANYK